jgi:hypothetical protein
MDREYIIKASYGNDSIALIQWMIDHGHTNAFVLYNDPDQELISVVGVRREESAKRGSWPEWTEESELDGGRPLWAPLVRVLAPERDELIRRAGFEVLLHRSDECFPCVNSSRADIRRLAEDPERVAEIEQLEADLSEGKPKQRRLFRRQSGIRETVAWAQSAPGEYVEDQQFLFGCDAGFCGL